jgi:hypothetical protein
MGSPIALRSRPSTGSPTGTRSGLPVAHVQFPCYVQSVS